MNTLIDCFGNKYEIINMLPTGFCGFHALSFCFTGTQASYGDIIDDCMNVFRNIPEMFELRTNFASSENSSRSVNDYAAFMYNAIQRVQAGFSVENEAWCEDGHLAAMALLYDVCICVYSQQNQQWHVFNEYGTRGYVCLLNSPGHFDVLGGVCGPPAIPASAHTHAVARHNFETSNDVWHCLQRAYRFEFVHAFPPQFTGINILNNPVVLFDAAAENVVSCEKHAAEQQTMVHKCEYHGCNYVGKNLKSLSMHTMRCHKKTTKSNDTENVEYDSVSLSSVSSTKYVAEQQATVHRCDYFGCSFVGKNTNSLSMHKKRCHGKNTTSTDAVSVERDSVSVSSITSTKSVAEDIVTVHKCDYPGCSFVGKKVQSLCAHKMNCHNRKKSNETVSMECDTTSASKVTDEKHGIEQQVTAHECDYDGCNFIGKTVKSLSMHQRMCHKHRKSLASSTVSKQTVDLSQNLDELCSEDFTRESEMASVVSEVVGKNAEPNITGCVFSDVEPDDISLGSVESARPKTEETVATKEGQYTCDISDCNSVHSTAKGLAIHKSRRHFSKSHIDDTMSVPVVQSDDVKSVESDSSTRSVRSSLRIRNMKKGVTVGDNESNVSHINQSDMETVQGCSVSSSRRFVCDVDGCTSVHNTGRSLLIHKRKGHSSTVRTEDAMSVSVVQTDDVSSMRSDNTSVSNVDSMTSRLRRSVRIQNKNEPGSESNVTAAKTFADSGTNTLHHRFETSNRKDNLKTSFSAEIAKAEKQFLPKNKAVTEDDPLYNKLKEYHDVLLKSVSNTTTEKLSSEVLDVVLNPAVIDDCDRRFHWSTDDEKRLNELNKTCKTIKPRAEWTWGAADDSEQGQYNDKRMQLCITKECDFKIIECDMCDSTGILVGDQTDSEVCYDCMKLKRAKETDREQKEKAWKEIKPKTKDFPKAADGRDLPYLQAGDKAVISPVHPVVTVKKNQYANKRLRIESITLVQDPVPTWCKVLPRTSLADRYMVIERRVQNAEKYIIANADRVRQWLRYLFLHHKEFIRLRRQNELVIDEAAIELLGPDLELAEVDSGSVEHVQHRTPQAEIMEQEVEQEDNGLTDATGTAGFSEYHVFSFDRYEPLYLNTKDVLRIRKEGKLEIIQDDTIRKPTYCTSANLAFPHLYPNGEMSPLDFGDYKLARYLLKKQALYAHRMSDGRLQWNFAEDDIHLAHQYSRLSEQTVRATVGYYIGSHPSVAHVPMNNILTAFKDGVDENSGLLDSHLPDLSTIMSQLPNSRQKWFCERLGIEAISRDIGCANVFVTINLDPRASPDVRRLIHKLEHGTEMEHDEPFVKDTAEHTRLMNKYAPFIAIFLYRKVKAIANAFFTKICGIEEKETKGDWKQQDVTETSWFWGRVEFTETRGVQHWHFLAKLPHVLDTGLLGRIIHNGRVVRQELKCGNIKPEKREEAWNMIEMGLLASRYATLFAHSISTASFYNKDVGIDDHKDSEVVPLETYRKHYTDFYKEGTIKLLTHPIMRRFDDPECRSNIFHEMAHIASVSCLHNCIRESCGGDPSSGDGCRFDFPKKQLKHTVAAVMQVNANQMEARVLLRRTCDRVANLNRYLIRYLRSNHDVSALIDSAHKLRYATKYCAKSGKHTQLLDEMIEHLNKRSTDLLPPNMKHVLSNLLLADCSHRAFMSKQELSYKVMNLPEIMKSFTNVDIVGFYKRANLQVPYDDNQTIEYSDRTEYSAYAERCRRDTELGPGLTKKAVQNMCLNDFAESVQHKWINTKKPQSQVIDQTTKRKFRTRDVNTGHWRLTMCRSRKHLRPSTVLHTSPAIDYEFVEHGKTTTQTTFYDLSIEKRHQLYRAYYELVMYLPWKSTPDETFLSSRIRKMLDDRERHAEIDSRHSLKRLEEFFKVYKQRYDNGNVASPGSSWQRDNQFSYSMFLVNQHNRDIHLDRVDNKGVLKAQYEAVDELVNVDVDIRPAVNEVSDLSEYPTFENFMPPDTFRDIVEQKALPITEMCVAFPLKDQWQRLEEVATHDKAKRFIANPPVSPVDDSNMTAIQKFAADVGKDENHQILFLCGRAGSGKTATALKVCEHFRGRVQATAYTGKAASLFNGPTIHSLFGWSHYEHKSTLTQMTPDSKKVTDFRVAHEDIDIFVIEEALAIPPAYFALMDEMMTAAFNPKHEKNAVGELPPFGGKKMLFLGDQAQLPPIGGPAVYDDGRTACETVKSKRETKQSKRTKTGQLIFEKYLVPNCIYLHRTQRNSGLLGEICDRMRQGVLTEDDCAMLTYQRTRFPDVCTDYGIHYQNEMCSMYNWRQLWNECKDLTPQRRMFLCKATYHVTADNSHIVDSLSTLPPQAYEYAPDILCVAEGCEVRLLDNVNIAAGLVTSQCGTVVKVVFNNADVNLLLAGEQVVPYCIVVSFAGFQGFVENKNGTERRIFPFPNQRTWVPVYRKRFAVKITSLPAWIRKKQLEKDCYRIQFPLDLATNITAHRAQGQTMADCLVSVDLGLQNPDMNMPSEISSLLYVACTRVTKLANLFVSQIHPCLWKKIGQSDADEHRRTVDEKLRKASLEFAKRHDMHEKMSEELAWKPDSANNAEEWKLLRKQTEPPSSNSRMERQAQHSTSDADFLVDLGDVQFSLYCTPVLSERHIGIDQGVKNFAIAVVQRTVGDNPNIVAVNNHTDLNLKSRFKATDVLVALTKQTDLLLWMDPAYGDNPVERVIVHLEQIDQRNRNSKQLSVELGRILQQQATDPQTCIVQMSSPHIHRSTGPLFHLGDEIVEALQLQPAVCVQQRSRAESNPSVVGVQQTANECEPLDVEPSGENTVGRTRQSESYIYRMKKKMSSNVFRYIVHANEEQLKQMKLTVDKNVQDYWRKKIASESLVKVDDVGDALLHALDELLCGSTNFKQLVPAAPSVHVNRTVAIAVFPATTYWIVMNCRWNMFVLENFGYFSSHLEKCFYKAASVVDVIKSNMVDCNEVWLALSQFEGNATHDAVDHVKVVVKQLTGHTQLGLTNAQAGALTDATMKAMKRICDEVIGINSKLCDRRDKILGSLYSRTSTVHRDRKFQVVNSTGKHTNAVLSLLSFMRQNFPDFVERRREFLSEAEKIAFFRTMRTRAQLNEQSMEMLQMSETVMAKLRSKEIAVRTEKDKTLPRNIADLVLVSMSKNQQHVKAVAANSGKAKRVPQPEKHTATDDEDDDIEH